MSSNDFLNNDKEKAANTLLEKENNSQAKRAKVIPFLLGFFIMLISYVILFFVFKMYKGYGMITAFFLALFYIVPGMAAWAVARFGFKKRYLGLGFLLGSFSPFLAIFVLTGGCGLFRV